MRSVILLSFLLLNPNLLSIWSFERNQVSPSLKMVNEIKPPQVKPRISPRLIGAVATTVVGGSALVFGLASGSFATFMVANPAVVRDSYAFSTLYLKYFVAGGACASLSHAIAVPIDVVKIRIQTYPDVYSGVFRTGIKIMNEEGFLTLFKGLGPTVLGYCIHGSLKYGFYEVLKPVVLNFLIVSGYSPMPLETKIVQFIIAGVIAETIASTAILPLEAARIRMISDPSFSSGGTFDSVQKVLALRGSESMFQSLPAILLKHVPFTVTQLTSFELSMAFIYPLLAASGLSAAQKVPLRMVATAAASLLSGLLASLVSQPGDTILSRVNGGGHGTAKAVLTSGGRQVEVQSEEQEEEVAGSSSQRGGAVPGNRNPFSRIADVVKEVGILGLYSGTGARLVHICVIYVVQLSIYDFIKSLFGIAPTGCPGPK